MLIYDLLHTDINMILVILTLIPDLTPRSALLLISDRLHSDINSILNTDISSDTDYDI